MDVDSPPFSWQCGERPGGFVETPPIPLLFLPALPHGWDAVGWSTAGSVIDGRGVGLPSPACLEGAVFVLAGAGMSSPLPRTVTSWENQRGLCWSGCPSGTPGSSRGV